MKKKLFEVEYPLKLSQYFWTLLRQLCGNTAKDPVQMFPEYYLNLRSYSTYKRSSFMFC